VRPNTAIHKAFLRCDLKETLISHFLRYTLSENVDIRSTALQAMGYLIIRCPSLLSKSADIFHKALSESEPVKIKLQVLFNFCELLVEQKKREKLAETEPTSLESFPEFFFRVSWITMHKLECRLSISLY